VLEARAGDEELFRRIVEAAPDAMVLADRDGRILLTNASTEAQFGYRAEELVGQHVELLMPERFRAHHRLWRERYVNAPTLRPMQVRREELFGLRRDGSEFPAEITLAPIRTTQGQVILADIQDATERKRLEQNASRLRDELIATVSHELRTPLTSIMGYTELLADLGDEDISARARPMLEVIERNAARELKLVEDLLTLAFYDQERLEVALAPLDIAELAHDVVEDQQLRAQETGVALTLDGQGPLPPVLGDRYRLSEVLDNLVSNALKFTPTGGSVQVRVANEGPMARLEVRDTGTGISTDEIPHLFDKLYRSPSAVAEQKQGAGLGLPIVKQIVDAHGGHVSVLSDLDAGTLVRVELPYANGRPSD